MPFLLVTLIKEAGNLFPYQISIKYLNPRLRYNYFRFRKRTAAILEFYFRFEY